MPLWVGLQEQLALKKIDLRHNKIGDEGANALAESLKTNSSLMFLLLSFNQIGPAGEHALLNALKMNSTISSTSLFDHWWWMTP